MTIEVDRDVFEGTIRYPPVLGIEPAGHGRSQRARLANTLTTLDGESVTVVFLGDRAEVAERLLVRGSAVRLLGVWDAGSSELAVDRFDIAGVDEDHRYRFAGRPAGEAASDVDVTTLYQANTVDGAGEHNEPPHSPTAPADHGTVGRFVPGQRVTARDRAELGTVVSVDDIPDRVRVRFSEPDCATAVVAFTSDQLEAHPMAGKTAEPAATGRGWQAAPAPPQSPRSPASDRSRKRQPATAAPSERTPPAASAAQGPGARRAVDKAGPVVGVLRVHTRRPEPSGELLL